MRTLVGRTSGGLEKKASYGDQGVHCVVTKALRAIKEQLGSKRDSEAVAKLSEGEKRRTGKSKSR